MPWQDFQVRDGDETVDCLLLAPDLPLPEAGGGGPRPLCLVPYLDATTVQRGRGEGYLRRLGEQLNAAGANAVYFTGKWPQLEPLAEAIAAGRDAFAETAQRLRVMAEACLERDLGEPGRVSLVGISRFGFQALDALATLGPGLRVDAVVASSPVVHWPVLEQFAHLEHHPVLAKHDLASLAPRLPPRPVLIQIGTTDDRVSTPRVQQLATVIESAYTAAGVPERFALHLFDAPGHQTTREFWMDVVEWLRAQGLL